MMHEREKSDPAIVAVKPTNKAERSAAEPVERRAGANGNADQHNTCRAQYRVSGAQALERIRQVRRRSLEVGAVCGKAARTVLCGGRSAMGVPTAIAARAPHNDEETSRQLVVPLANPVQTEREADALFGGLENDKRRGLGGAELAQELVIHHHLAPPAVGQAPDKTGAADVLIVELQAEARGPHHAQ